MNNLISYTMRVKSVACLAFIVCIIILSQAYAAEYESGEKQHWEESVSLYTQTAHVRTPIQSWKTLRDARIVKQDLDYSCSAASLATLLNEFYGRSVTEEAILNAMNKGDLRASFEDMQKSLATVWF